VTHRCSPDPAPPIQARPHPRQPCQPTLPRLDVPDNVSAMPCQPGLAVPSRTVPSRGLPAQPRKSPDNATATPCVAGPNRTMPAEPQPTIQGRSNTLPDLCQPSRPSPATPTLTGLARLSLPCQPDHARRGNACPTQARQPDQATRTVLCRYPALPDVPWPTGPDVACPASRPRPSTDSDSRATHASQTTTQRPRLALPCHRRHPPIVAPPAWPCRAVARPTDLTEHCRPTEPARPY